MEKRNFSLGFMVLIFSFFITGESIAQSTKKIKKKEIKELASLIKEEQYTAAQFQGNILANRNNENPEVNFLLGLSYYLDPLKKDQCEPFLRKALSLQDNKSAYYLGKYLSSIENFDDAERFFIIARNKKSTEVTLADIDFQLECISRARTSYDDPKDYEIENLGNLVNSNQNERYPWISYDQQTLYFISDKEQPINSNDKKVYFTEMTNDSWKSSVKVNEKEENHHHIEVLQWASLGKTYVEDLAIKAKKNESNSGDLKWIKYSYNSNTPLGYLEASACVNKENTVMFFAAKRNDSKGGKDIFVVKKLPTGTWTNPQNLGDVVNSFLDEESPYFHEPSRTLYFSSKGHETLGGFDIFKVKLDENFLPISREHFEYPLNSAANELELSVNKSDEIGYFISDRKGGHGGFDLYSSWISVEARLPSIVKGIIRDENSNSPLVGTITLIDEETQEVQGVFATKEKNGSCIILLERGKTYEYYIESNGYITHEGKLSEELNNISEQGKWMITLKKEE